MGTNRIALLLAASGTALLGASPGALAASNPKSAVITVPCGVMNAVQANGKADLKARTQCKDLHSSDGDGDKDDLNTVELYSGGVLLYTETNAMLSVSKGDGDSGQVSILLTGNGTNFHSWYQDAATSWLNSPDLTVKILQKGGSKKAAAVKLFQHYSPVGSAIWAQHSEDAAQAQANVDAETARAKAAEAALDTGLAAERAARIAGDQGLSASLAAESAARSAADAGLQAGLNGEIARAMGAEAAVSGNLAAEIARAMAAEGGLSAALTQEVADRKQGDADSMAAVAAETARAMAAEGALAATESAHEMADAQAFAAESAARQAGDAALMAAVAAETARAQTAEANLQAAISAEMAARQAADASLSGDIAAEGANRMAADNALSGQIGALQAALNAYEAQLAAVNPNGINNNGNAVDWSNLKGAPDFAVNGYQAGQGIAINGTVISNTGVLGNGTVNKLAKFTGGSTVGDSSLSDDGATMSTSESFNALALGMGGDVRTSWNNQDPTSVNPMPRNCGVGQIAVSTGAFAWKCGASCSLGTADCDGSLDNGCEIVAATDVNNCGACGNVCSNNNIASPSCSQALCNGVCDAGFGDCDNDKLVNGCETSVVQNDAHCGACGMACGGGTPSCCASACTNLTNDKNNCGGCGNVCSLANAVSDCSNSGCVVTSCNAGFANCNNQNGDGCEINTNGDANNCGGCGVVCPNNKPNCVAGVCGALISCNGTKTYNNVTLINLGSECSGSGNFPYNGCNGAYGVSWVDATPAAPSSVQLKFSQGLSCAGLQNRTTTFNNQNAPNFFENASACACSPPDVGVTTITLANNQYNLGGTNTFMITNPGSCEGLSRVGGVFATATVTYMQNNIDPGTDLKNCGGCGNVCNSPANASPKCAGGVCGFGACNNGFANCNNNVNDGCEINTNTDNNNCGGCGVVCNGGKSCSGGVCVAFPAQCKAGNDLETNSPWVVCQADANGAWVSMNGQGGNFHALQICQTLGYAQLGQFGGTCGNTCGFCQGATSCNNLGNPTFDGAGNCGADQFGQILCNTVQWRCIK